MFSPDGNRATPTARLHVESLEGRDLPSLGSWWVEPFQSSGPNLMPQGWSQWSNGDTNLFTIDRAGQGLGGQGRLVSASASWNVSRAWLTNRFAADVEASAAVYLNSPSAVQLLVRGNNLNTTSPTYYAASITRGLEVQLVKVVQGKSTVLGTLKSAEYLTNAWVQVRIRADGDTLRLYVHRGDTNQYLGSDGRWTRSLTPALERRDAGITTAGQVGFARPGGIAGDVALDSLRIGPSDSSVDAPIREERFDGDAQAKLPSNWTSWSGAAPVQFEVSEDETLRINTTSAGQARAWMTQPVPQDSQVSSSIYVDGLVPAGVFTRGSSVNSAKPTYYGVNVTRGLEVELVRVVNGVTTVLGKITTQGWQSNLWVQVSLVAKGNQLRVLVYRSDAGQYLDSNGNWGLVPTWALARTDNGIRSGGLAGISRGSGSADELIVDNFLVNTAPTQVTTPGPIPTEADKATTPVVPPVPPPPPPPPVPPPPVTSPPVTSPPVTSPPPVPGNSSLPNVAQSFSHIRVANLAYHGTPFTDFERNLIRHGVDLVIPNLNYVDDIAAVSATKPQMIYTNVSNVYLGLLTDWLEYADRNKVSRESAFYHVTKETPFSGMSASAVPVDRFWGVYRGSDAAGWTNLTRDIRIASTPTSFASLNQSLALGYTEKFREINIDLRTMAAGTWRAELEYVRAVDSQGRPTAWGRVSVLRDTTGGLRRDGQFTFDPPSDWVAASISGSARLFYVRFLTVNAGGTAPISSTILGRDYTKMSGLNGTIPAFDHTADANRDGYLSDAEYARRRPGFEARFVYETRLTFPFYGPNRFATNPASVPFQNWVVDYHRRVLQAWPQVAGFFVDNSTGRLTVDPTGIAESLSNYAVDYGNLLGRLNRSLGTGKWIVANTSGGGTSVDSQIRNGVSYLEEFALRPMTANYVQFEDLAATIRYRRQLSGGKGYEILDSLPQQLDAADPRVMSSTLAMYYLVADPKLSMLMINGGNEPASSWTRHWMDAIRFNVGKPLGEHTLHSTGKDPADTTLTYKIFQRRYENALVLYKPVSYIRGRSGGIGDNTRTTVNLDGLYRVVNANGSLGPPVRQVTLRNGEGLVLAKA